MVLWTAGLEVDVGWAKDVDCWVRGCAAEVNNELGGMGFDFWVPGQLLRSTHWLNREGL